MKAIPRKTGTGHTTFYFEMTEDEFREFDRDECCIGVCIACGTQGDERIEPDARHLRCSTCMQPLVFSVVELVLSGRVQFTDEVVE